MSQIGTQQGRRLTASDKRSIRTGLVLAAQQSGTRAYRYAYDGDQLYEYRGWADGKCVRSEVTDRGISTAPQRRVLAAGVSARVACAGGAVLLVAVDVLSRLLT